MLVLFIGIICVVSSNLLVFNIISAFDKNCNISMVIDTLTVLIIITFGFLFSFLGYFFIYQPSTENLIYKTDNTKTIIFLNVDYIVNSSEYKDKISIAWKFRYIKDIKDIIKTYNCNSIIIYYKQGSNTKEQQKIVESIDLGTKVKKIIPFYEYENKNINILSWLYNQNKYFDRVLIIDHEIMPEFKDIQIVLNFQDEIVNKQDIKPFLVFKTETLDTSYIPVCSSITELKKMIGGSTYER